MRYILLDCLIDHLNFGNFQRLYLTYGALIGHNSDNFKFFGLCWLDIRRCIHFNKGNRLVTKRLSRSLRKRIRAVIETAGGFAYDGWEWLLVNDISQVELRKFNLIFANLHNHKRG